MIKLFRISKTEYIDDPSGLGARLYGGRWNHPGNPVIYSSGSRSLAVLEYLVHTPMALAPDDLSIAEIHISGTVTRESISPEDLPPDWRICPALESLAEIGTKWIKSKSGLLFNVPSAVVEKEYNTLINPLHPDMSKVSFVSVEPFHFDSRFFK